MSRRLDETRDALALLGPTATGPVPSARAAWLYADHRACLAGAPARPPAPIGAAERAADAAMAAHALDRDDLHWGSMTHPGSVIWPVCDALGDGAAGGELLVAAGRGYEVMAGLAGVLRLCGVRNGHATAVAGAPAAAATAATLLGGDVELVATAIGLAASVAGGVGQTMLERSSAAGFHRAAAAVVGIAAARAARAGARPASGALLGEQGLVRLHGGDPALWDPASGSPSGAEPAAIDATSIRPYPVHGLAQTALHATVELRHSWTGATDVELAVEVHPVVASMLADPASCWWGLAPAVSRAWELATPWIDDAVTSAAAPPPRVRVVAAADLAVGSARITADGDGDRATAGCDVPFLTPEASPSITFEKWRRCGIADPAALLADAAARLGTPPPTFGRS